MTSAQRTPSRVTPFDNPVTRFMAGRFGVRIFLVSLGILFATTLIAFLVIRIQIKDSWPTDLPALPGLLLLSTGVMILSSVTLQRAMSGVRGNRPARTRSMMVVTLGLGLGFLVLQGMCWWSWLEVVSGRWGESAEYRFALSNFYVLTGLHALHVIGGLIPMFVVTRRAFGRGYTPDDCAGITYCAMYWHFLDGVWVILYLSLLIGT